MRLVHNIVLAAVLASIALVVYFAGRQPAADVSPPAPVVPSDDVGILPLDESQRVRLETATDNSPTVDEAAFYALLENAAAWGSTEATDQDLLKPKMANVLADPAAYRGKLCIIEGKLAGARPVDVSFDKWRNVRVWYIRMADGSPDPDKLYTNTLVAVYLTDPLALARPQNGEYGLTRADYDKPIRVVGRFLKVLRDKPVGDPTETREYPVFVAKRAYWTQTQAPPKSSGPPLFVFVVLFIIGGYIALRVVLSRRSRAPGDSPLEEQRRLRAERLRQLGADVPEAEPDIDLPDDPAAALDTLEHAHDEDTSHGDR